MLRVEGLVDTSVLVAFFNREDEFFERAVVLFKKLEGRLILIDVVINETLALLRKRVSKKIAVEVADQLMKPDLFEFKCCDEDVYKKASKMFIEKKGKYSFTDCVLALEAMRLGKQLFSFDSHFADFEIKLVSE